MKNRRFTVSGPIFILLWGALAISCAGAPLREDPSFPGGDEENPPVKAAAPPESPSPGISPVPPVFSPRPLPGNLRFVPEPTSLPPLPHGVGNLTRESRDHSASLGLAEKKGLEEAFRAAYQGALLRGLPLEGALGGDEVHGWPPGEPLAWVQNWRTAEAQPNSWGSPSLVLAVRSLEGGPVFTVQGPILDVYGRSRGRGGANGARGYGPPRGNEFFREGGPSQPFTQGLIFIDAEGRGAFSPHGAPGPLGFPRANAPPEPPFSGAEPPELSSPGPSWEELPPGPREAFRTAWEAVLIRGGEALIPDAPVEYSPLASWPVAPGKGASGLYSQSFNQAAAILALPEIGGLPLGAFLLEGPFLDALLAAGAERLPGAESLQALEPLATARAPLTQALLQGLALYGLPLTESLPRKDKETASYREAQRFSQGWMERTGKL